MLATRSEGWRLTAIQCKRYSTAVMPAHAAAFGRLVRQRRYALGLYVHCGWTGPATYRAIAGQAIMLISGERLLTLVLQQRMPSSV